MDAYDDDILHMSLLADTGHPDDDIVTSCTFQYRVCDSNRSLILTADASEGCGGHVWASGVLLANALQCKHYFPDGYWKHKRVCELGAGTGISGLVAGVLGSDVTVTDLPQMMPIMTRNVRDNFSASEPVRAEVLCWGTPAHNKEYDVILAADVLYLECTFQLLLSTLLELCTGDVVLLLGYMRRWKPDWRFFNHVLPKYFTVTQLDEKLFPNNSTDGQQIAKAGKRSSHVFQLRRKKL